MIVLALREPGTRLTAAIAPSLAQTQVPERFQRSRQLCWQVLGPRHGLGGGEVGAGRSQIALSQLDLAKQSIDREIVEMPREREQLFMTSGKASLIIDHQTRLREVRERIAGGQCGAVDEVVDEAFELVDRVSCGVDLALGR